jgi:hypothetical protein
MSGGQVVPANRISYFLFNTYQIGMLQDEPSRFLFIISELFGIKMHQKGRKGGKIVKFLLKMTRFYKIYLRIVNNCCKFAKSCAWTPPERGCVCIPDVGGNLNNNIKY